VPKRSTPSRAAVMMALPNVDGSNRPGRLDVLRGAAEVRDGRPVAICTVPALLVLAPTTRGVSSGDDC